MVPERPPFRPLLDVFGDQEIGEVFSEKSYVESWLEVERALAEVQAEFGVIPADAAAAIRDQAVIEKIDFPLLREETRVVGYPIVSLIQQVASQSPSIVGEYLHWGATTQDIMDTGLVLQIRTACQRIRALEESLGRELAQMADEYRGVVMAARTHAQQAVPTTLGAKLAVWLDEMCRHLERLSAARERALVVQLFGAAGTSAAMGPKSAQVRHGLAEGLGIHTSDVPWHTSRDALAELGFVLAAAAGSCGKMAREVIELSRTEIGEVREQGDSAHGSSSTMPQKANPSLSEAIVGMSELTRQQVAALLGAMQGTHERSAGEWQVEWDVLPALFTLAAGCLDSTRTVLANLGVYPDQMRANLGQDGGMVMAEAAMMALSPELGRLPAHELVSAACRTARDRQQSLAEALAESLDPAMVEALGPLDKVLDPESYLGEAEAIVDAALRRWDEWTSSKTNLTGG